jgi:hypothetical protein
VHDLFTNQSRRKTTECPTQAFDGANDPLNICMKAGCQLFGRKLSTSSQAVQYFLGQVLHVAPPETQNRNKIKVTARHLHETHYLVVGQIKLNN